MVKRKVFSDDEIDLDEAEVQESKRQLTFENAVRRVIRGLSTPELVSELEPFIRIWVREEMEQVFQRYMNSSSRSRPIDHQIEVSGSRGWRLHFRSKLPKTIFTGNRIKADDKTDIKIAILAANSDMIITAGPLSSLKVEILVLKGDFGNDHEDWAQEDFDASVLCEREGRRPLLAGDLFVTLKDGVGFIGDITLTDNSCWTRSRTFRLGARIVRGTCGADRVREARSGAFVVKERRGECYEKRYPPSLGDEVWRLEGISKNGVFHKRLTSYGIDTVQDFRRVLVLNSHILPNILRSGMSNKKWHAIVQHASSCVLDNKRYIYDKAGQQVRLLFDSIHNVVGASFDGCSFLSLDNLSSYQMSLVESVKQLAYQYTDDIYEIVCPMVDVPSTSLQENSFFDGSSHDEQIPGFQVTDLVAAAPQMNLNYTTNSFSSAFPVEDVSVQGYHPVQRSNNDERGRLINSFNDGCERNQGERSVPTVLDGNFKGHNDSQIHISDWMASWEQGTEFFLASGDETGIDLFSSLPDFGIHMTNAPKPNMGWFKLRAAFKSVVPFCHSLAARRARFHSLVIDC